MHIDRALNAGCKLHGFRSGGGLRVMRLEDAKHKLRGYGEHPHADEALKHCSEDYAAGGRPYDKVYGKQHTHYLTGSTEAQGQLDAWILKGHTIDARKGPNGIVVELLGSMHFETPKEVLERVLATTMPEEWEERGFRYRARWGRFPNGEACVTTAVLSQPEGVPDHLAFSYQVVKRGEAKTFSDALALALAAELQEVPHTNVEA